MEVADREQICAALRALARLLSVTSACSYETADGEAMDLAVPPWDIAAGAVIASKPRRWLECASSMT
jgi:hypothetical protein